MPAADFKPLPGVPRLRERVLALLADHLGAVGDGNIGDAVVDRLAGAADAAFGLPPGGSAPLLSGIRGVPASPEASMTAESMLTRWVPALRAGHRYRGDGAAEHIPHTVLVTDPAAAPDTGRWHLRLSFLDGPLAGTRSDLAVGHRMACMLVVRAFGPRLAYSLDRPRPYDLHGTKLLIYPTRVGAAMGIRQSLTCAALKRANKALRGRFGTCPAGRFDTVCFDCGAGEAQCPLARHTEPLSKADCACCGRNLVSNNKGVCILCLDKAMRNGTPIRSGSRSAMPRSS